MIRFLTRAVVVLVILIVLGLIGRSIPGPPKRRSSPETREEGIQRISADYGFSQDEVRRAMERYERNR
jgi:ABC-type dipeptide/oligopeptide/nickel transport system permease component